jgi:hypothetical protein
MPAGGCEVKRPSLSDVDMPGQATLSHNSTDLECFLIPLRTFEVTLDAKLIRQLRNVLHCFRKQCRPRPEALVFSST